MSDTNEPSNPTTVITTPLGDWVDIQVEVSGSTIIKHELSSTAKFRMLLVKNYKDVALGIITNELYGIYNNEQTTGITAECVYTLLDTIIVPSLMHWDDSGVEIVDPRGNGNRVLNGIPFDTIMVELKAIQLSITNSSNAMSPDKKLEFVEAYDEFLKEWPESRASEVADLARSFCSDLKMASLLFYISMRINNIMSIMCVDPYLGYLLAVAHRLSGEAAFDTIDNNGADLSMSKLFNPISTEVNWSARDLLATNLSSRSARTTDIAMQVIKNRILQIDHLEKEIFVKQHQLGVGWRKRLYDDGNSDLAMLARINERFNFNSNREFKHHPTTASFATTGGGSYLSELGSLYAKTTITLITNVG